MRLYEFLMIHGCLVHGCENEIRLEMAKRVLCFAH